MKLAAVVTVQQPPLQTINDQIGQHRSMRRVKGAPLMVRPHHFAGRNTREFLQRMVPVGNHMIDVDHEGGHRTGINDLLQVKGRNFCFCHYCNLPLVTLCLFWHKPAVD